MSIKKRWIPFMMIGIFSFIIGMIVTSRSGFTPFTVSNAYESGIKENNQNISANTFVEIAQRLNPTVVYISSTQTVKGIEGFRAPFGDPFRDFFGDDFFDKFFNIPKGDLKQKGLGSGFIIDEQGYILTNHHVVRDAEDIVVTLSLDIFLRSSSDDFRITVGREQNAVEIPYT